MLVKGVESLYITTDGGVELEHGRWRGPWEAEKVLQEGLSVGVTIQGRQRRRGRVSVGLIKPPYRRPEEHRHPMADEFAQQVSTTDLGLPQCSKAARPLYTMHDGQERGSFGDDERSEVGVYWEASGCD